MNLLHLADLKNPNKKIPVHKKEEKGLTRITQNTVILWILKLLIHLKFKFGILILWIFKSEKLIVEVFAISKLFTLEYPCLLSPLLLLIVGFTSLIYK